MEYAYEMLPFKLDGVQYRFDFYEQTSSSIQFKNESFKNKIPELSIDFSEDQEHVRPHMVPIERFAVWKDEGGASD